MFCHQHFHIQQHFLLSVFFPNSEGCTFILLRRVQDEGSYVYELGLFQDGPYKTVVFCLWLLCESVMEAIYYASKIIVLPDVCYYCDGRSASPLCNNAEIKQLQKECKRFNQFAQVVLLIEKNLWPGEHAKSWKRKNEVKHFLVFYIL